ncbi:hypothetical protein KSP39_PZI015674 [Platanthera zijinensis]|uniref:Uncharacterized protein n=1 Tax=Platanthera zijinensis TaxID=2320716 RepID=A0AAP0B810_9ASPA
MRCDHNAIPPKNISNLILRWDGGEQISKVRANNSLELRPRSDPTTINIDKPRHNILPPSGRSARMKDNSVAISNASQAAFLCCLHLASSTTIRVSSFVWIANSCALGIAEIVPCHQETTSRSKASILVDTAQTQQLHPAKTSIHPPTVELLNSLIDP